MAAVDYVINIVDNPEGTYVATARRGATVAADGTALTASPATTRVGEALVWGAMTILNDFSAGKGA